MGWRSGQPDRPSQRLRSYRLRRIVLRRAAGYYAQHGWDVVPGACLDGSRFDCGRPVCHTVGCHPAVDDWEARAAHAPETVAAWWRELPYTVLLATGRAFDVLEVPADLGRLVTRGSRRVAGGAAARVEGPLAVAPDGRWMFFVAPGAGLWPDLAERPDVVLHGPGSWVPAPPSRQVDGPVRWRLHPRDVGFEPANPQRLQRLIVAGLPASIPVMPRLECVPARKRRAGDIEVPEGGPRDNLHSAFRRWATGRSSIFRTSIH